MGFHLGLLNMKEIEVETASKLSPLSLFLTPFLSFLIISRPLEHLPKLKSKRSSVFGFIKNGHKLAIKSITLCSHA